MPNKTNLSCQDLSTAFKNIIASEIFNTVTTFNKISIDSRNINKHDAFLCLKGANTRGESFIQDAVLNGASCIIGESIQKETIEFLKQNKISYFIVSNTELALQQLAVYKRSKDLAKAKVIAITGSVGKTTVTKLIASTLANSFKITHPEGNFNNHIGLPLTIVNATYDSQILVLEMGMNHYNEIKLLSQIAKPDIAIITSIAPAHIEFFEGKIENIIKAKTEIFEAMSPNGIIVLNETNEFFNQTKDVAIQKGFKNIFSIGGKDSQVKINNFKINDILATEYDVTLKEKDGEKTIHCIINTITEHHAINSLFAIFVGRMFKIPTEEIINSISTFSLPKGRGNIEKFITSGKNITAINDCYNANPESMKQGIKSLKALQKILNEKEKVRTVCILGNMGELGERSEEFHAQILNQTLQDEIDAIITVGKNMQIAKTILPKEKHLQHFLHSGALAKNIKKFIQNNDIILFKGSRSVNLEIAIESLYK